jgi:hypothetical protein
MSGDVTKRLAGLSSNAAPVPLEEPSVLSVMGAGMNGQAMVNRETWRSRMWRRLGFNGSYDPGLIEFRYGEMDGFAESSMMTEVVVHFTLGDRLRLLLTGELRVETSTRTDVEVRRSKSMSRVTIMSPGYSRSRQ